MMAKLPNTNTERGQCEASVMLARMCGWEYRHDEITGQWHSESGELLYDEWRMDTGGYGDVTFLSLYNSANMALAWRVLNWLDTSEMGKKGQTKRGCFNEFYSWWINNFLWMAMPPADAQRAWLDKILELAIEAGMLEAQP